MAMKLYKGVLAGPGMVSVNKARFPIGESKDAFAIADDAINFRNAFAVSALHAKKLGGTHWKAAQETGLTDERLKTAAVIAANASFSPEDRVTLSDCIVAAKSIDLFSPEKEKAYVRMSKSKKPRPHIAFGLRNKARQYLLRDSVHLMSAPRKWQVDQRQNSKGRSVQSLIGEVRTRIEKGNLYAIHLDMEKFYASFTMDDVLGLLALPTNVIQHVAMASGYMGSLVYHYVAIGAPALTGLAFGSSASPSIAAHAISKLRPGIKSGFWNYADDFVLIGPTEDWVQKSTDRLHATVAKHLGASFSLKEKTPVIDISKQELRIFGHRLLKEKKKVWVRPQEKHEKYYTDELFFRFLKTEEAINEFGDASPEAKKAYKKVVAFHKGWMQAFKNCDGMKQHQDWFDELNHQCEIGFKKALTLQAVVAETYNLGPSS